MKPFHYRASIALFLSLNLTLIVEAYGFSASQKRSSTMTEMTYPLNFVVKSESNRYIGVIRISKNENHSNLRGQYTVHSWSSADYDVEGQLASENKKASEVSSFHPIDSNVSQDIKLSKLYDEYEKLVAELKKRDGIKSDKETVGFSEIGFVQNLQAHALKEHKLIVQTD
jgi:hypothetical protein